MIGMPVGGLCAGLLYLGGDGKLWLWDIMNQVHEGVLANGRDGLLYAHPLQPVSPVKQGFSLQIKTGRKQDSPARSLRMARYFLSGSISAWNREL